MTTVADVYDFDRTIKVFMSLEKGREKAEYLMDLFPGNDELVVLWQSDAVGRGVDPEFLAKVFTKLGISWYYSKPPQADGFGMGAPKAAPKPTGPGPIVFEFEGRGQGYTWGKLSQDGAILGQINALDGRANGIVRALLMKAGCLIKEDSGIDPKTGQTWADEVPF